MKIIQMKVGNLENFTYFIIDEKSKISAVIDPGFDSDYILDEAKKEGVGINKILLTHGHFDHTMEAEKIATETGATTYIGEFENYETFQKLVRVSDKNIITLGNIEIECIFAPGHSPGGVIYKIENNLFTGDTLFVEGCGRTDLPGGDSQKMYETLSKIKKFPKDFVVYPGHDYGSKKKSTIGYELENNRYFKISDHYEFLKKRN